MKLFDRDLSWLSYNSRILQEAAFKYTLPAERLKFVSIASSNLKIFIRERLFALINSSDEKTINKAKKVSKKISKQFSECSKILNEIFEALKISKIEIRSLKDLDEIQLKYLNEWFRLKIKPFLHPRFLNESNDLSGFENGRIYLYIQLVFHEEKGRVIIEIPFTKKDRFVELPASDGKTVFVFTEELIIFYLSELFPGHEIPATYLFESIAGNKYYSADEEQALFEKLSVENEHVGNYFLFNKNTPKEIVNELIQKTKGNKVAIAKKNSFLGLIDFSDLGKLLPAELRHSTLSTITHSLENSISIIKSIKEKDQLLFFPYHSFNIILNFLKEAATSNTVKNIFITIYRTAPNSVLIEHLITAASNGKQVFAFLEIKASESEEENILLAKKLEAAGVVVSRNFPDYKIHAKTILVEEESETDDLTRTALISTGNFNENTADKYTDVAILSANNNITQDVASLFKTLNSGTLKKFKSDFISFSPITYRQIISKEIYKCIDTVKENKASRIILKVNNLEDEEIISELYNAAQAGVKIEIIVRSICCMKSTDNIRIISIVDHFLEHARIFSFCCGSDENLFITSADLMTRNLDRRIEFLLPINNPIHRKQLHEVLQLQLRDNSKARLLDKKQKNKFVEAINGEATIRSQFLLHDYFSSNTI